MIKKLSDSLTKNIFWKILSLILAICLWILVVNLENPLAMASYRVPVTIQNLEKVHENGYVLLNEAQLKASRVEIFVRAAYSDIQELDKLKNNITAYIDLAPIDVSYANRVGDSLSINIDIDLPKSLNQSDFEIIRKNPSNTNVVLDYYETIILPISVDRTGEVRDGYISMPPVINPTVCEVSGARSMLEQIGSVKAAVDLKDASGEIYVTESLSIISVDGADITDKFEIDIENVEITVPIYKVGKIPVRTSLTGTIAEGYVVDSVDVDPAVIEVVGNEEDVNGLTEIVVGPVSVENINASKTRVYDVRNNLLNTNLSVKNGSAHEVTVTVNIVPEVIKTITVSLRRLNVIGLTTEVDLPAEAQIVVKGTQEALDNLDTDSLMPIINLTDLTPGLQEVLLDISLPKDVSLVQLPVITVNILEAEEPDEDVADEENTAESDKTDEQKPSDSNEINGEKSENGSEKSKGNN